RGRVDVAASNSPRVTVVSGVIDAVERLCDELSASNVFVRLMRGNTGAGHSPLLDPYLPEFRESLASLRPRTPVVDLYSSTLGRKIADDPLDAAYWARNFREPVRFTDATRALGDDGFDTFLELGPHPSLLSSIEQTLRPGGGTITRLGSLQQGVPDRRALLDSLARLHTAGLDVHWAGVHPEGSPSYPLPRYPWRRQRYWLPGPFVDGSVIAGNPRALYDRRVSSARPPHETYYELSLDPDRAAQLGVPRVLGRRVVSAGLLLALARASVGGALTQLELHDAAVIDESLELQLVLGDGGFEIFAREPEGWRRIASGRRDEPSPEAPLDVAEGEPDPDLLRRWQAAGLELERGSLEAATRRPTSARARLRGRAEDPAVLEAAVRLLASLVHPPGATAIEGELFELRACTRASLGEGAIEWVRAQVHGPVGPSFGARGDVQLLDAEGNPVSTLRDVELGVDRSQARRALLDRQARWLYSVRWPVAEPPASSAAPAPERGVWLLGPDAGGLAEALADRLRARGDSVVMAGESPARALVDARGRGPLRGVVHLRGLDLDDTAVPDAVERCSLELLAWIHALGEEGLPGTFVLVTRGAQPVDPGPLCVSAGPLWGLGRTIGLENPALSVRLIDLDPARPSDELVELVGLIAALDDPGPESCIALRAGVRRVERLLRAPPLPATPPLEFRPDATYLVTGGLGGIGLHVARWLVDRGARHLLLLGRSGADTPERRAAVERLRALGATVEVASTDVADAEALGALLDAIPQAQPLRGIFHAAGITDPRPLAATTPQGIARLYHAKVRGAWALHTKTRALDLDHFVSFSSAASVWGAALLGPYGAANHFLDVLAHHRRALGLPALSVNWGGWSGGGMATADVQRYAADMGLGLAPAALLLEALDLSIASGTERITIASVMWRTFKAVLETRGERPLLAQIEVEAGSAAGGEVSGAIEAAAPAARWTLLVEHVQSRAAAILGFEAPDGLDPEVGFFQLGMDSVMSVRLRNELERDLGVALPPTLAFEQPDVMALSRWLAHQALDMEIPIPRDDEASALDDLSEAELESLLAQELDA
ncbi:MAG: SDR family NAD(P)-dependent oxidoreductase, partial [Myxococcales bacterium]|nr:SDR family NAD(P)-dependent oxidoreductase [Myxococcales bacterium]